MFIRDKVQPYLDNSMEDNFDSLLNIFHRNIFYRYDYGALRGLRKSSGKKIYLQARGHQLAKYYFFFSRCIF